MESLRQEYEKWFSKQVATTGTRIGQFVKNTTVKGTANALENVVSKLPDISITPGNLFLYDNYQKIEELETIIKSSQYYRDVNEKDGNGYPNQGIKRYKEFLKLREFHQNYDDAYNAQSELDDYLTEQDINSDTSNTEDTAFGYLKTPRFPELLNDSTPTKPRYKRSKERSKNALKKASFSCEIDGCICNLFKRKNSSVNYTEPHHLIPMKAQIDFTFALDTEENIVSLCSHCHNKIHYGNSKSEITNLYNKRKQLLESAGIPISLEDLLAMYGY